MVKQRNFHFHKTRTELHRGLSRGCAGSFRPRGGFISGELSMDRMGREVQLLEDWGGLPGAKK